jgi:hypothetical protein
MHFSRERLQQLKAEARTRAEASRLERAVLLVTKYRDFQPFAKGPDRDLAPDVLQRARAVRSYRYKRGLPQYAGDR